MGALVLVHTVLPLIALFNDLCAKIVPAAEVLHVLDEPLLRAVQSRGGIVGVDVEHLRAHVAVAAELGARAVLVTCSSISPAVDRVRKDVAVPVFKIDEAMIRRAVQQGSAIGVIATVASTLEPTRQGLVEQARIEGKRIWVKTVFVDKALQLLKEGKADRHDSLVRAAIRGLVGEVDEVVLAQATIARVLEGMRPAERKVPVLASPYLALEQVRPLFEGP